MLKIFKIGREAKKLEKKIKKGRPTCKKDKDEEE
jgi:hypothetical protein